MKRDSHAESQSKLPNEGGYVLLLGSVFLVTLLAFGSLTIDLGWGFFNQRHMQIAADLAAIAGVRDRHSNPATTIQSIKAVATAIALENGLSNVELGNGANIETGIWNNTTRVFTVENTNVNAVNAVRVAAARNLPTFLSLVFGQGQLAPTVNAVAKLDNPTSSICVVPFAIEEVAFEGKNYGSTITIGDSVSSGNWGKIEPVKMNPQDFIAAFETGLCSITITVGQVMDGETGVAKIHDVFDDAAKVDKIFAIAVVPAFPKGKHPVTISGFATVMVKDTRGNSNGHASDTGNGKTNGSEPWEADLIWLDTIIGNGVGGGPFSNDIVLVQ